MNEKGIITVISGFSGAGKGTVVNGLVTRYGYALSISATTRAPRTGEKEGVHYFFKTKEQFEKMIADGELMEYAPYVDNYYGTPKEYVMQQRDQGKDVLLEIEMQGALKIKKDFPDVSLVFISPPDVKVLRERLEGRGTESQDVIEKRLRRAAEECLYMDEYDYIVINDNLDDCVEQIHRLIQSIHLERRNQQGHIQKMKESFAENI
ncbi:MAG: guanylate kinase [Lachnospiraceae bacterium]|nr:guanylate kinase [Lachnospiraceae bacterium]